MRWVDKHIRLKSLLALCFATLFLIAQTHASTHSHDEGEIEAECSVCVIGSQLDDANAPDNVSHNVAPDWISLAPSSEQQLAYFSSSEVRARAPPVS